MTSAGIKQLNIDRRRIEAGELVFSRQHVPFYQKPTRKATRSS